MNKATTNKQYKVCTIYNNYVLTGIKHKF